MAARAQPYSPQLQCKNPGDNVSHPRVFVLRARVVNTMLRNRRGASHAFKVHKQRHNFKLQSTESGRTSKRHAVMILMYFQYRVLLTLCTAPIVNMNLTASAIRLTCARQQNTHKNNTLEAP